MAKKKMTVDDLPFGDDDFEQLQTNPLYTGIFGQPAQVNKEDELVQIPINQLYDFPNHPYKVVNDEKMIELRDSITDNGILSPLLVMPRPQGGYTIISGHRRKTASKLAQLANVPAIVKYNLTDDQAVILMVDSNKQRELVLPSERAKAYKMKYDAMKRQGQRNDLTFGTGFHKLDNEKIVEPGSTILKDDNFVNPVHEVKRTDELIGESENMSGRQVRKYIRLTRLIPQILDLVDNDALKLSPSMALKPAVEISYLTPDEQKYFYDTVKVLDKTPSHQQAIIMKQMSARRELTQTAVMQILQEQKPNQKETVKIDTNRLYTYFDNTAYTPKEFESMVFERLDGYEKIKNAIESHLPNGKDMTDDELATIADNALKAYANTQKQRNSRAAR